MTTWQEPRPGTKRARIVRMLRRPEGVTFGEAAKSAGMKSPNARAYITTMRSEGLAVLERKEEGRGRVWYVVKVDRRKRSQDPEPVQGQARHTASPHAREYLDRLGIPLTDAGLARYAVAALHVAWENPLIEQTIRSRLSL